VLRLLHVGRIFALASRITYWGVFGLQSPLNSIWNSASTTESEQRLKFRLSYKCLQDFF